MSFDEILELDNGGHYSFGKSNSVLSRPWLNGGADVLMDKMIQAEALLADKAYDVDERMKQKLKEKDSPVIPFHIN